ncbi:MAG: NADH-quinone oxidoreductase subunit H [Patescibacteria group bacterium]
MIILVWIIQIILMLGLSPLLIGVIKKIKARLQNRQGISFLQPYRDLWKLFHKDEIISQDASWIFKFSPYLLFSLTIFLIINLPILGQIDFPYLGDFLLIVYTLAIGTFFLALAGLDVGSAFGGFGSSREMTLASLAEGGLVFSFLVLAIVAKTTNLTAMADFISSTSVFFLFPIILVAISFVICLLVENSRYPFDNPSTHLELTMVHEAMILEYSGKRLALVEWSAYNKLFIFVALAASLFLPFGLSFGTGILGMMIYLAIFVLKVLLIGVFVAVLESSLAKFRFFRLPDLLFTAFILNALAIILIISLRI